MKSNPPGLPGIIVALDVPRLEDAGTLVEQLSPHVAAFKVGMELCTAVGVPAAVKFIHERGGKVFLDLKFGDIPNTVGKAIAEAAKQGVWMANVHASCGAKSMEAAAKNRGDTIVIGVTVLTSIGDENGECANLYGENAYLSATRFAALACCAGLNGVVCAVSEVGYVHGLTNLDRFMAVTPGIRPEWYPAGDQKRLATPAEAARAGSDYVVIGRPITNPPQEIGSPADAAQLIIQEFQSTQNP
jgi:orotidine-5'-phosphate decarboxylase